MCDSERGAEPRSMALRMLCVRGMFMSTQYCSLGNFASSTLLLKVHAQEKNAIRKTRRYTIENRILYRAPFFLNTFFYFICELLILTANF